MLYPQIIVAHFLSKFCYFSFFLLFWCVCFCFQEFLVEEGWKMIIKCRFARTGMWEAKGQGDDIISQTRCIPILIFFPVFVTLLILHAWGKCHIKSAGVSFALLKMMFYDSSFYVWLSFSHLNLVTMYDVCQRIMLSA